MNKAITINIADVRTTNHANGTVSWTKAPYRPTHELNGQLRVHNPVGTRQVTVTVTDLNTVRTERMCKRVEMWAGVSGWEAGGCSQDDEVEWDDPSRGE